jgi:NADP-dependent 3-hydroxy acid dehydrogenase YdfG
LSLAADVRRWEDMAVVCARTAERFGRIDAVFANAGVSGDTSFIEGTFNPDDWREMVLTNVLGTAFTARAAMPYLASSGGHLLITGSVAGTVMVPGDLYSATKWAAGALARSIRAEAGQVGVRVTLVQPGLVAAGDRTPGREDDPTLDPDDVARAVLYALTQPRHVDVSEIVVRPLGQDPHR